MLRYIKSRILKENVYFFLKLFHLEHVYGNSALAQESIPIQSRLCGGSNALFYNCFSTMFVSTETIKVWGIKFQGRTLQVLGKKCEDKGCEDELSQQINSTVSFGDVVAS